LRGLFATDLIQKRNTFWLHALLVTKRAISKTLRGQHVCGYEQYAKARLEALSSTENAYTLHSVRSQAFSRLQFDQKLSQLAAKTDFERFVTEDDLVVDNDSKDNGPFHLSSSREK
jgi:hypothetical protein